MIGLSGGLGPFRASVSTRGVGGSVGPLNVGASYRGSGEAVRFLLWMTVIAVAAMVVWIALTWPYMLGRRWLDGTAGVVLGVALETIYLVGVPLLVWRAGRAMGAARDRKAAIDRRRQVATARADVIQRGRHILDRAPAARAEMSVLLDYMEQRPRGFLAHEVTDLPDHFPKDERFFGAGSATLCGPRVRERGGPRVQTPLEQGSWSISDTSVRFHGATRTDRWPLAALEQVTYGDGRVLLSLRNRKTITGLCEESDDDDVSVLRICLEWARADGEPIVARELVEASLRQFDADMDALRVEISAAESAQRREPGT